MTRIRCQKFSQGRLYLYRFLMWKVIFIPEGKNRPTIKRRFFRSKPAFRYYFDLVEALDSAERMHDGSQTQPTRVR